MNRAFTVIIILCAVVIGVFLPVKVPCTITTPCKLLPNREWLLMKDTTGGTVTSFLANHGTGTTDRHFTTEPVRGDAFELNMKGYRSPGQQISQGDTVAVIVSYEAERELYALSRELAIQKAMLRVAESGEKQELIIEAQRRLEHAREVLAEQERITARLDELQASGFVSYQEYETAKSDEDLYRIAVSIAEAEIQSLRTGAKPEEADLIRATIETLGHEIEALQAKLNAYNITTPISGLLLESPAPDTLIWIADTSSFVAFIPLRLGIDSQVVPGQEVRLTLPGTDEKLSGSIMFIGNSALLAMREQVVIATARFGPSTSRPVTGTVVECDIICPPMYIRTYLVRIVKNLFAR